MSRSRPQRGAHRAAPDPFLPGSGPLASTEAPLEMLAACHVRIDKQCRTLRRLVGHLSAHGADAEASKAAQAVLRYFDDAAVNHHQDEERDLFPALLESVAGSEATCIRDLIDRLRDDHRRLEALWAEFRGPLQAVQQGQGGVLDAARVEALVTAYEAHIALEESQLLPMAARLLTDLQIGAIGRAMRERRGIPPV